ASCAASSARTSTSSPTPSSAPSSSAAPRGRTGCSSPIAGSGPAGAQEAVGATMASEANEPGSESGKRSDDRRGAARGTRAGSWSPQEGGASNHWAARLPPRSPGSFASLAMVAPTASCAPAGPLPAIGLEHPVLPRGAALEDGALLGVGEDVEVLALDAAHDAACDLLGADDAAHHGGALGDGRLARVAQRRGPVADRVLVDL